MKHLFFLLLLSQFISGICNAQVKTVDSKVEDGNQIHSDSTSSDTTHSLNTYYLLRASMLYSFYFGRERNYNFYHSKTFSDYPSFYNTQQEIQFEKFKKEMYRILALKYKDYTKYDLGEIGYYLGLSKNIMAIVLAIISIL